jgi:hypothetical protein
MIALLTVAEEGARDLRHEHRLRSARRASHLFFKTLFFKTVQNEDRTR